MVSSDLQHEHEKAELVARVEDLHNQLVNADMDAQVRHDTARHGLIDAIVCRLRCSAHG